MRRVRWLATVVPIIGLILLGLFNRFVLERVVALDWRWAAETAILVLVAIPFSFMVVRVFERLQNNLAALYADAAQTRDRLRALQQAGLTVSSDLTLDRVLQRVVDISRNIIGARYAALAILRDTGQAQQIIYSWDSDDHPEVNLDDEQDQSLVMRVPLTFQHQTIGHLYLAGKEDNAPFAETDRDVANLFAAHAAAAIVNARLYSQVQRLAVVEERQRIGMDLHDGTIQQLYAIGLTIESVMDLVASNPDRARARLDRLADQLNQTIADIRHYIFDLRTQAPGPSLPEAIAALANQLNLGRITRIVVQSDRFHQLSRPQVTSMWHISREALSNAARHAHPKEVVVTIGESADGAVTVEFSDDGQGFDQSRTQSENHHGLRNMASRALQSDGQLTVESGIGQGTRVLVRLHPNEDIDDVDAATSTSSPSVV